MVRYSAGVLNWTGAELKGMDIKTRKILTLNGMFHQKGNVDRLYMPRRNGGRGLISVEDCVRIEELNLNKYLRENPELLLCAAEFALNDGGPPEEKESGKDYKGRVYDERCDRLKDKTMHGKFFRDVEDIGCEKSFTWITKGYLTKNTEGLIFAAQEQALQTNWLKAKISGGKEDARCRKCKKDLETVSHLISACSELCQVEYRKRHDRMGLRVYWEICKKYHIECSSKWYEEIPDRIRKSECGNFEIWWDRSVETPDKLDHNKPDLIVIDRLKGHWTIIDFSVPNDKNVASKEKEKVEKYTKLACQIRKMRKVSTSIIPLVVGALGTVTNSLEKNLKRLEIPYVLNCMAPALG